MCKGDSVYIMSRKSTYILQGFSCISCANKFEENVRKIDTVEDVQFNFSTGLVSIIGDVTIDALKQAAAFEQIKIYKPKDDAYIKSPFWADISFITTLIASVILFVGILVQFYFAIFHSIIPFIYLIALAIAGYNLFKQVIYNLFAFHVDVRVLLTISVIGTFMIGRWIEAVSVIILFNICVMLVNYTIDRARYAIMEIISLAPNKAVVVKGNESIITDVQDVKIGDIISVKPGETIALDGIIVEGSTIIEANLVTQYHTVGEKSVGDEVFAGSINTEKHILIKVTCEASQTILAKTISLVESALTKKAPAQHFIENIAKYYTPVMVMLAILLALLPPVVIGSDWLEWIYLGLATLIIACPWSIIMSPSIAMIIAIGNIARNGVLIKDGTHIEEMNRLKAIAFDKTGTLTSGKPYVSHIVSFTENESRLIQIGASIEQHSNHPYAKAICHVAKERNIPVTDIMQYQSVEGRGAMCFINGIKYIIGHVSLFRHVKLPFDHIFDQIEPLQDEGHSIIVVGTSTKIIGYFVIIDEIREEAPSIIKQLKQLRILEYFILTGDEERTARAIAKKVSINNFHANLLPEEKMRFINKLRGTYRHAAMIAYGSNDALALASASVGFTIGTMKDDSLLNESDVIFLRDDLTILPKIIRFSKKAVTVVQQNILIVFGIKIFALVLVIPGLLTLWMAVIANFLSILFILINSLRLKQQL